MVTMTIIAASDQLKTLAKRKSSRCKINKVKDVYLLMNTDFYGNNIILF